MQDNSPLFWRQQCRRCGEGFYTCKLDTAIFCQYLCCCCTVALMMNPDPDENASLTPTEVRTMADRLAFDRAFAPLHSTEEAGFNQDGGDDHAS